jgi:hypothetical protein
MTARPRLTPAMVGMKAEKAEKAETTHVNIASLILDLPGERLETIEVNAGCAVHLWGNPPSGHRLLAAIAADQLGGRFETYRKMTMRELSDLVVLEDDDDEDDDQGEVSETSTPEPEPRSS